ncbi:MAG: protein BatD [bacterium]|nr:protein BatD [bacterium]
MKRALLVMLALVVPMLAVAQTPQELMRGGRLRVRVSTEPARQVVIGQQTRFFIDILTDTWFTKAPAYPELVLEGAIALMPEQLGTNFTERIDGATFAAQRRSYVIFPQRAGRLEIPSLKVRLGVAAADGKAGTPFTLRTQPLRLNVVIPAEAEGIESLVTTPRFRVRDKWSRPLDELKVGDAVERTVRMTADRALGMLLPELAFEAPPGIAVYTDQPRSSDRINRGQYQGERVESVTYVLQRPGEFTLPAIELHWWSSTAGALQAEILEERTFEVSGEWGAAPLLVPVDRWARWRARFDRLLAFIREHRLTLLLAVLGVIIVVQITRRSLPSLLGWWRVQREQRRDSEALLFRKLSNTAQRGDIDAVVHDFWRWRDRLAIELPLLTHGAMRHAAETSGFAEHWASLEQRRYGTAPPSSGSADLRPALQAFRTALLTVHRSQVVASGSSGLNPRGRQE